MSDKSAIQWTEATWNPIVGCSKALRPGPNGKPVLRQGCANCYAIDAAATPRLQQFDQYKGLTVMQNKRPEWTGKVNFVESKLDEPLRWRKPRMIFVNSMSDLFHESVPTKTIDLIFAVMALTPRHTYQILTKRPDRMMRYLQSFYDAKTAAQRLSQTLAENGENYWSEETECCIHNSISGANGKDGAGWPLKNVWLGVSVEDQGSADYAIPLLLATPAEVRWISAEPLVGGINLEPFLRCNCGVDPENDHFAPPEMHGKRCPYRARLHWAVVGGESGPRARCTLLEWIRKIIVVGQEFGLPIFVKQVGAVPVGPPRILLTDRKGGKMADWPLALRIRQFPEVRA